MLKTHLKNVISHNAIGLDENLMNHRITVVTLHLMCTMLIVFNQRQQQLKGEGLSCLTVAQFYHLNK